MNKIESNQAQQANINTTTQSRELPSSQRISRRALLAAGAGMGLVSLGLNRAPQAQAHDEVFKGSTPLSALNNENNLSPQVEKNQDLEQPEKSRYARLLKPSKKLAPGHHLRLIAPITDFTFNKNERL